MKVMRFPLKKSFQNINGSYWALRSSVIVETKRNMVLNRSPFAVAVADGGHPINCKTNVRMALSAFLRHFFP